MKPNDETLYEAKDEQPVLSQEEKESIENLDNSRENDLFRKRAMILGGAVLSAGTIGGGIALSKTLYNPNPEEKENVFEIIDENDDKSFEEAFDHAREKLGPGAAFRWHGGVYNTYTKDEWDNMSDAEKEDYNSKVRPLLTEEDTNPNHYNESHEGHHGVRSDVEKHEERIMEKEQTTVTHKDEYVISSEKVAEIHGKSVIMAEGIHNGNSVVYIDVDKDGVYDIMVEDVNQDGQVTDDEYIDIHNKHLNVHDQTLVGAKPVSDEWIIIEEGETEINGHKVILAVAEHNGERTILIDADRDGTYDIAIEDRNHDGQVSEDECFDISNNNLQVQDASLIANSNGNMYAVDTDPVVEVDYNTETKTEDGIFAKGTVDGKAAIVIDVNKDGTYDMAIVDQNANGQIDENERNPINIVSANAHVRNASMTDNSPTDNSLNHQDDNTPDYMNTLASNNTNEAEVEVTVDVEVHDTPSSYTAMEDSTNSMNNEDAAMHYQEMAFNNMEDSSNIDSNIDDVSDDYGSLS